MSARTQARVTACALTIGSGQLVTSKELLALECVLKQVGVCLITGFDDGFCHLCRDGVPDGPSEEWHLLANDRKDAVT